jgi:hypothetical protein
MLYLHRHVGDAFAFMNVQVAWQRVISNPLLVLLSALRDGSAYDKYCALLVLAALATSIYLARVGLAAEAWTLLFATIIPLTSAVWSMQRFAFAIYPPYLAIGVLGRRSYGLQMLVLCALSSFGGFFIFSWVAGKAWMI